MFPDPRQQDIENALPVSVPHSDMQYGHLWALSSWCRGLRARCDPAEKAKHVLPFHIPTRVTPIPGLAESGASNLLTLVYCCPCLFAQPSVPAISVEVGKPRAGVELRLASNSRRAVTPPHPRTWLSGWRGHRPRKQELARVRVVTKSETQESASRTSPRSSSVHI